MVYNKYMKLFHLLLFVCYCLLLVYPLNCEMKLSVLLLQENARGCSFLVSEGYSGRKQLYAGRSFPSSGRSE